MGIPYIFIHSFIRTKAIKTFWLHINFNWFALCECVWTGRVELVSYRKKNRVFNSVFERVLVRQGQRDVCVIKWKSLANKIQHFIACIFRSGQACFSFPSSILIIFIFMVINRTLPHGQLCLQQWRSVRAAATNVRQQQRLLRWQRRASGRVWQSLWQQEGDR